MKILLIGGGGREHALAWKFTREDPAAEVVASPGNPGIAALGRCVGVSATDVDSLLALALAERPHLTVVGPETPLALGIVDRFRAERLPILGPTRAAAEIESSKAFAKQLMVDAGVPTARAERHTDPVAAKRAARAFGAPVVIKASGLAAGKGVIVAETVVAADEAIDAMLSRHVFGSAGAEILVEEFMRGEEVSILYLTDGERWLAFPPAQDHKRLLVGDRGPNTGGMGAYAPAHPLVLPSSPVSSDFSAAAESWPQAMGLAMLAGRQVVDPVLSALRAAGRPFTGVLYAGLMITDAGLKVVEFNCRMGDPETQAILPLITFPILPLVSAVAQDERLDTRAVADVGGAGHAVTAVVAAAGYPVQPRTGDVIHLPPAPPGVLVFHAGTARDASGQLVTAGGRVLAITGVASDLESARRASTEFADQVDFAGKQFRHDIAWRELARARAP